MIENVTLLDKLEESNKALEASENNNNFLRNNSEKVEKELNKVYTENKLLESKVKELKKKHMIEVDNLNNKIKAPETKGG